MGGDAAVEGHRSADPVPVGGIAARSGGKARTYTKVLTTGRRGVFAQVVGVAALLPGEEAEIFLGDRPVEDRVG